MQVTNNVFPNEHPTIKLKLLCHIFLTKQKINQK